MFYFHGSVGICSDFYPVAVMKYPDGSKLRKEGTVWLTIPGYGQSLQQSQGGRKSEQLITSQPHRDGKFRGLHKQIGILSY